MPIYCYTTDDGQVIEEPRTVADRNRPAKLPDGRLARRNEQAQYAPRLRREGGVGNWPMVGCMPMDVIPQCVQDARRDAGRRGIPITFLDNGKAVLNNAGDYARAMKKYGMRQNNSWGTKLEG